jgi:hypothetical protein
VGGGWRVVRFSRFRADTSIFWGGPSLLCFVAFLNLVWSPQPPHPPWSLFLWIDCPLTQGHADIGPCDLGLREGPAAFSWICSDVLTRYRLAICALWPVAVCSRVSLHPSLQLTNYLQVFRASPSTQSSEEATQAMRVRQELQSCPGVHSIALLYTTACSL